MENLNNLNQIVANNIIKYRKMSGLTQAELADKLNFSDKSVSKWERGDAIPDLEVLLKLCNIFEITLNDIVSATPQKAIKKRLPKQRHLLISLISGGVVWLIATIVFVCLSLILPSIENAWLCFVIAVPVSAIVLFIFACIWGKPLIQLLLLSIFIWTAFVSVCIPFGQNIWLLLCIAIPLQILAILGYILLRLKNKNKKDG